MDYPNQSGHEYARQLLAAGLADAVVSHSVAVLGLTGGHLQPCGAGTLVMTHGRHYILTAAHVWSERLMRSEDICISIRPGDHAFCLKKDHVVPMCERSGQYSVTGPDICLLRIPDTVLGAIEGAHKVFYNIDLHGEAPRCPADQFGVHWITGAPKDKIVFKGVASLDGHLETIAVPQPVRLASRNGYDYQEFILDGRDKRSYQGFSGAGVWWGWLDSSRELQIHLDGVAFFESPEPPENVKITCHGPHSIAEIAARANQAGTIG